MNDLQKTLRETGTSAVMATHDRMEALRLSDRIAVMKEGRILQIGASEEVMNHPGDEFVASFIGMETIITGTGGHRKSRNGSDPRCRRSDHRGRRHLGRGRTGHLLSASGTCNPLDTTSRRRHKHPQYVRGSHHGNPAHGSVLQDQSGLRVLSHGLCDGPIHGSSRPAGNANPSSLLSRQPLFM